ncbi:MAG: hypothetical protein QM785_05830 [Pyrinomonadaceae bacterium]
MKTCTTCRCSEKLSLRLENYSRDERIPFIERVLGSLIESRFRNGRFESLDDLKQPRNVAEACFDLHPKPFVLSAFGKFRRSCSVPFRAFRGWLSGRPQAENGAAAPTGAASIPACQRLQTASASRVTQLVNPRAP